MHPGRHAALLILLSLLSTGLVAPANAADPVATTLSLTADPTYADSDTTLRIDLVQSGDGAPVAAGTVLVERRVGGAWSELGPVVTDETGHAELAATLRRTAADNVFRATYAGDPAHAASASGPVAVALVRRSSRLVVRGPDSVVDEQSVTLRMVWKTGNGLPVPGRVKVFRRLGDGDWSLFRVLGTGSDGVAELRTTPRADSRWQARGAGQDWVEGDLSPVHRVDNLPPGEPVLLPSAAPHPRIHLPAQPHAAGAGPHAVISRIPDGVWRRMTGVTWHAGCPVGRAGLRLLRINYWDYHGYRRRGELVANADAVGRMAAALAEMYDRGYPLRALYRVDRFGYSGRVRGGDDFASMAAGNTSAFNCRDVVNKPGVRSPHSWGRSLDVNTWENPYRSARGLVPNRWWQSRSHPRVAWRSRSHAVVQIMGRHGLRWTYGLGDTQHFDVVHHDARMMPFAPCNGVCE